MPAGFPDLIAREREHSPVPPRLGDLAERFVAAALELLFPHFVTEDRAPAAQLAHVRDLLEQALAIPGSHEPAVLDHFVEALAEIRSALLEDARAIYDGDPAAESVDEVILAYPGFYAIAVYRLAHQLCRDGVPLFPRLLTEVAHRRTGIDVHPGARIGAGFSIDHGTGIVIGETAELGDRVKLYQGVTLGAASVSKHLERTKRHPTIGDNVIIYANATILGGETVIGAGTVIGGNVWLTHSVPAHSIVAPRARVERQSADGDDILEFNI